MTTGRGKRATYQNEEASPFPKRCCGAMSGTVYLSIDCPFNPQEMGMAKFIKFQRAAADSGCVAKARVRSRRARTLALAAPNETELQLLFQAFLKLLNDADLDCAAFCVPSGIVSSANLDAPAFLRSAWHSELARRRAAKEVECDEAMGMELGTEMGTGTRMGTGTTPRLEKEGEGKNGSERVPVGEQDGKETEGQGKEQEKEESQGEGEADKEAWCDAVEDADSDGRFESVEEVNWGSE